MRSKLILTLFTVVASIFGCGIHKESNSTAAISKNDSVPNIVINYFKVTYPTTGKVKLMMQAEGKGGATDGAMPHIAGTRFKIPSKQE